MTSDFDAKAATWDDDPAKRERAAVVARCIRAAVPLHATTRLLEYGAGTGLVTQELLEAVGPVTLADSSAGMLAVLHEKLAAGALGDARIWDLDLSVAPPPAGEFDLVVTVLTLHHIPDLAPVLGAFAALLTGGGHLCIADLEEEDGSFHGAGFHGHRGFAPAALAEMLTAAGFADVRVERCGEVVRDGTPYPMFLATAQRPAR